MLAVASPSLLIPELKIFLKTILKINSLQRAVLFLIEYFVIKYKRLNFSNYSCLKKIRYFIKYTR